MKSKILIILMASIWFYFMIVISLSSGYYAESSDIRMDAILARLSGESKKADSLSAIADYYMKKAKNTEKFFKLF